MSDSRNKLLIVSIQNSALIVAAALLTITSLKSSALSVTGQPLNYRVEGIEWKTLPDAVAAAQSSQKKIMVDVFTDWCFWCKKMDTSVYGDMEVQKYLADHFELVKLNAESESKHIFRDGNYSERQIAGAFEVDGYPTTLFLSSDAQMITAVPGYLEPKTFLAVLEFIHDEHYKSMSWQDFSRKKGIEQQ